MSYLVFGNGEISRVERINPGSMSDLFRFHHDPESRCMERFFAESAGAIAREDGIQQVQHVCILMVSLPLQSVCVACSIFLDLVSD